MILYKCCNKILYLHLDITKQQKKLTKILLKIKLTISPLTTLEEEEDLIEQFQKDVNNLILMIYILKFYPGIILDIGGIFFSFFFIRIEMMSMDT